MSCNCPECPDCQQAKDKGIACKCGLPHALDGGCQENEEQEEEDKKPITVLQLAKFRGAKETENGFSMGEIERVGLPFMGGCALCGACIACYSACPSKTGYLLCLNDCVGEEGYATVEEANIALFPQEYEWKGVKVP